MRHGCRCPVSRAGGTDLGSQTQAHTGSSLPPGTVGILCGLWEWVWSRAGTQDSQSRSNLAMPRAVPSEWCLEGSAR